MRIRTIILAASLIIGAVGPLWARTSDKSAAQKPFTLVLDPGHGGKDSGCVGDISNEKTIVLNVAKMLGEMVKEAYGDSVKTVFTRNSDTFISLQERANIANRAGGDFFVSIHVNSVDKRSPGRRNITGASVYTLGLHKSENNLGVAMRENAVMELEEDFSETYQGFDPNSSESYIIFELSQDANIKQSLEMASLMQGQLTGYAGRADKDVRQAGFWVLWSTSMPSVLVELDFICNPQAERFLASKNGQKKCAEALFRAFKEYYRHHRPNAS
ncbi:MAG: N-acetylmuramoyl-L-alanine amidase [Muribaculaceae bacterium]|nr:N-acetylmuramoyl-L-alanine amidase [Muribaculaceae bacterium]